MADKTIKVIEPLSSGDVKKGGTQVVTPTDKLPTNLPELIGGKGHGDKPKGGK